ncbi:hypothetical protein BH20ACI1_BH20ACI1_22920 [soil metagenome]
MFVEISGKKRWSSVGTAYFYVVPTELDQYLANLILQICRSYGTKEFPNSFLLKSRSRNDSNKHLLNMLILGFPVLVRRINPIIYRAKPTCQIRRMSLFVN